MYPDRYTIGMVLNPGGFMLEAYDFKAKRQVFWFAESERTLLNRYDLGMSFSFDSNKKCNCSKIDPTSMLQPDFLRSFAFVKTVHVDSPNFPASVECHEWREGAGKNQITVLTTVSSGDPVKLSVGDPVTRYNWYHPLHQVVSFGEHIFDVPVQCSEGPRLRMRTVVF